MTITKIEQQRHNEKRFSVFIDGEFSFGLSDVDVLYYKLKEYDEISAEKYENIIQNVIYTKAKDAAYRFVGYKPRTEKEVRQKLEENDYGDDTINRVIDLLKNYGYVDDHKFTAQYVAEKTGGRLGDGRVKLMYELRQKGVDERIISSVLEETPLNEEENALKHIEKKLKGETEIDMAEKRRLYGYLARRGFSYDTIQDALEKYFALFK